MDALRKPGETGNDLLRGAWLAVNGVLALVAGYQLVLRLVSGRSLSLMFLIFALAPTAVLVLWWRNEFRRAAALSAAFAALLLIDGLEQWVALVYFGVSVWRLLTVVERERVSEPGAVQPANQISNPDKADWDPIRVWRAFVRLPVIAALVVAGLAIAAAIFVVASSDAQADGAGLSVFVAGIVAGCAVVAAIAAGVVVALGRRNVNVGAALSAPLAVVALGWAIHGVGHGWVALLLSFWGLGCLGSALAILTAPTKLTTRGAPALRPRTEPIAGMP